MPVVFFHTRMSTAYSQRVELNKAHLHLFGGSNIFARKRLATEHGIKFGFVVRPKKQN